MSRSKVVGRDSACRWDQTGHSNHSAASAALSLVGAPNSLHWDSPMRSRTVADTPVTSARIDSSTGATTWSTRDPQRRRISAMSLTVWLRNHPAYRIGSTWSTAVRSP